MRERICYARRNDLQKGLQGVRAEPPLHTLIAERTGVTAKQVYKVLLAYRLCRFREKWG